MKLGFLGRIFRRVFPVNRESFVIGGHLKITYLLLLSPFSLYLFFPFFFVFLVHKFWSSWAIGEERESWVVLMGVRGALMFFP